MKAPTMQQLCDSIVALRRATGEGECRLCFLPLVVEVDGDGDLCVICQQCPDWWMA